MSQHPEFGWNSGELWFFIRRLMAAGVGWGRMSGVSGFNRHELGQTSGDGEGQEAWCATVYGTANSQTQLGDWTTTTLFLLLALVLGLIFKLWFWRQFCFRSPFSSILVCFIYVIPLGLPFRLSLCQPWWQKALPGPTSAARWRMGKSISWLPLTEFPWVSSIFREFHVHYGSKEKDS